MSTRRKGREAAVQYLCGLDAQSFPGEHDPLIFWEIRPTEEAARRFAMELIKGVTEHRAEIDALISASSHNFKLQRLAVVDRNVLRVAIYEMLHSLSVPPVVAINEAIEIARKFGDTESARFVNGVLDNVASRLPRPLRDSKPA
jgi:N utilization substance protein B